MNQGGPDSYVGMIGSGAINPGQLVLITGSSHLQLTVCGVDSKCAPGIWVSSDHVFLSVCVYICLSVCPCVCVRAYVKCVRPCVYVCMCLSVYPWVPVCVSVYVSVRVSVCFKVEESNDTVLIFSFITF